MGFKNERRALEAPTYKYSQVFASTAPSTAFGKRGAVSLATTSTGAAVVYTLTPPREGEVLEFSVLSIASSSVGVFRIVAGSGILVSSTCDQVQLSTDGAGVRLVGLTSARWGITGNYGGTLSTST